MDRNKSYEVELKRELDILNKLVERALKMPIKKNEQIIEQSRKVDKLIDLIQKEKITG